jgi:hypothetical protein
MTGFCASAAADLLRRILGSATFTYIIYVLRCSKEFTKLLVLRSQSVSGKDNGGRGSGIDSVIAL